MPTSIGSSKKQEFQKNIFYCFIDYAKAFHCVDHNKLWKILQEMGLPDHLTCLLRNLYAGQEATVRSGRGTTDWFQIAQTTEPSSLLLCLQKTLSEDAVGSNRFCQIAGKAGEILDKSAVSENQFPNAM